MTGLLLLLAADLCVLISWLAFRRAWRDGR